MEPRIPNTPPVIEPLANDIQRPLWSVMIPAYNCIRYLEETLRSVLLQDPGPEWMQIEVVDDCSTDGDVMALVCSIGNGRVGYYRQKTNRGSLRNFETCLNRAQGKWVHLLHGDDMVKPGFYREIEQLFCSYPEAGAAFTSHSFMDEDGNEFYHPKALRPEPGLLENWLHCIAQRNRLQPPAIVVKRCVYEKLGGFFAVHFGEDWEMWVRIASQFPFAYSPKSLALYRVHKTNISSRSFLSGQNVKDLFQVIGIIQHYIPLEERKRMMLCARKNASRYIAKTARKVINQYGDPFAALVQAHGAIRMHVNPESLYMAFVVFIKCILWFIKRIFCWKPEKEEAEIPEVVKI